MASSGCSELSDSVNEFTLDIFKHVTGKEPDKNAFMSPSSMLVALAMLHAGTRNNTEMQMSKVLKLEKMERKSLLAQIEKFVGTLRKGSDSVTLQTANRLFPHVDRTILEEYLSLVKKHFHADVKGMDFTTKFEEARQEINKWVEGETNGKIKDLLPGGSLNSLTAMVVVNAIYFKGNWETQFDPASTRKSDFTKLDSSKTKVDMMHAKLKKVKYGENHELDCKVLEIPYQGSELGMTIILPNTSSGLPALEKKLTVGTLRSLLSNIYQTTVDVSFPKFKLETSLQLKTVLSDLGMPDLFSESKADLSGMGKDLYVSEVFHKAFVDVNEEGTEAGAATGAVIMKRSIVRTMSFNADHPFLFMIWDHRLQFPLFIGTEAGAATGAVIMKRSIVRTMSFNADHPFLFMIWDHRLQVPLFIGRFMEPASTSVGDQQTHEEL